MKKKANSTVLPLAGVGRKSAGSVSDKWPSLKGTGFHRRLRPSCMQMTKEKRQTVDAVKAAQQQLRTGQKEHAEKCGGWTAGLFL